MAGPWKKVRGVVGVDLRDERGSRQRGVRIALRQPTWPDARALDRGEAIFGIFKDDGGRTASVYRHHEGGERVLRGPQVFGDDDGDRLAGINDLVRLERHSRPRFAHGHQKGSLQPWRVRMVHDAARAGQGQGGACVDVDPAECHRCRRHQRNERRRIEAQVVGVACRAANLGLALYPMPSHVLSHPDPKLVPFGTGVEGVA